MTEGQRETKLSEKAIKEFKKIYRREFRKTLSDGEANEMGLRLLGVFEILATEPKMPGPIPVQLTLQERKVVAFIRTNPKASVREITAMLGLKSSRSGFRVVQALIGKGALFRHHNDILHVIDGL